MGKRHYSGHDHRQAKDMGLDAGVREGDLGAPGIPFCVCYFVSGTGSLVTYLKMREGQSQGPDCEEME